MNGSFDFYFKWHANLPGGKGGGGSLVSAKEKGRDARCLG